MSASQPPQPPSSSEPSESLEPLGPPPGSDAPTLLVKIFGKDRPGITAGLFDTLAAYAVDVVDIEQVVTRGRIVLCALVTAPTAGGTTEGDLRATVHSWADSLKLQAEIISGIGDNRPAVTAVPM